MALRHLLQLCVLMPKLNKFNLVIVLLVAIAIAAMVGVPGLLKRTLDLSKKATQDATPVLIPAEVTELPIAQLPKLKKNQVPVFGLLTSETAKTKLGSYIDFAALAELSEQNFIFIGKTATDESQVNYKLLSLPAKKSVNDSNDQPKSITLLAVSEQGSLFALKTSKKSDSILNIKSSALQPIVSSLAFYEEDLCFNTLQKGDTLAACKGIEFTPPYVIEYSEQANTEKLEVYLVPTGSSFWQSKNIYDGVELLVPYGTVLLSEGKKVRFDKALIGGKASARFVSETLSKTKVKFVDTLKFTSDTTHVPAALGIELGDEISATETTTEVETISDTETEIVSDTATGTETTTQTSCGNGTVDPNEQCDDGNTTDGDGCEASCVFTIRGFCNGMTCDLNGIGGLCRDDLDCYHFACNGMACDKVATGGMGNDPEDTCSYSSGSNGTGCSHIECRPSYNFFSGSWGTCVEVEGGGASDPTCSEARAGCAGPEHCGNGVCDKIVESHANCPQDCPNQDPPSCGDGITDPSIGEECDDRNTTSGDGCSSDCRIETTETTTETGTETESTTEEETNTETETIPAAICGNSELESGETCDDGNVSGADGCNACCQIEDNNLCGNGIIDNGDNGTEDNQEDCDDANHIDNDGCSSCCESEDPDEGGGASPTPSETPTETPTEAPTESNTEQPTDSIMETATESYTEPPTESETTTAIQCGNNQKDSEEQCDGSSDYGDDYCRQITDNISAICNSTCNCQVDNCGNKQLEDGEECDPSSSEYGSNYCKSIKENTLAYCEDCECRFNTCGNTQLDNEEECDSTSSDYGTSYCQKIKERDDVKCKNCSCIESCGDSTLDAGEECDDGNLADGDGCSSLCKKECGNGVIDSDEECDDANQDDADGCDQKCKIQVCCICEWQDNAELACDNNAFKNDCDEFIKESQCEHATQIIDAVQPRISRVPENNPKQWCIYNPDRKTYSQCSNKKTYYEYNGHGERDTAAYCINAIAEACTETGSLPPKYLDCVFNTCYAVADQESIETVLTDIQKKYPWINWSASGLPQTYFMQADGTEQTNICQPRLKYTINADGLKLTGNPCSEVINTKTIAFPCGKIETTICIDDSVCPLSGNMPVTKTLYGCPDNVEAFEGKPASENSSLWATWQEEKCDPIDCRLDCLKPPSANVGCQQIIGTGDDKCSLTDANSCNKTTN